MKYYYCSIKMEAPQSNNLHTSAQDIEAKDIVWTEYRKTLLSNCQKRPPISCHSKHQFRPTFLFIFLLFVSFGVDFSAAQTTLGCALAKDSEVESDTITLSMPLGISMSGDELSAFAEFGYGLGFAQTSRYEENLNRQLLNNYYYLRSEDLLKPSCMMDDNKMNTVTTDLMPIYSVSRGDSKLNHLCTKSSSTELIPLSSDPYEDCKHSLPTLDSDTESLIPVIMLDRHLKNQDYHQCTSKEQVQQLECSLSDNISTVTTCSLRKAERIRSRGWYWSTYRHNFFTIDVDTTKYYLDGFNSTALHRSLLLRLLFNSLSPLLDQSILIYFMAVFILISTLEGGSTYTRVCDPGEHNNNIDAPVNNNPHRMNHNAQVNNDNDIAYNDSPDYNDAPVNNVVSINSHTPNDGPVNNESESESDDSINILAPIINNDSFVNNDSSVITFVNHYDLSPDATDNVSFVQTVTTFYNYKGFVYQGNEIYHTTEIGGMKAVADTVEKKCPNELVTVNHDIVNLLQPSPTTQYVYYGLVEPTRPFYTYSGEFVDTDTASAISLLEYQSPVQVVDNR